MALVKTHEAALTTSATYADQFYCRNFGISLPLKNSRLSIDLLPARPWYPLFLALELTIRPLSLSGLPNFSVKAPCPPIY